MWTKSGISSFQTGSSLFSRGRVRYRRELVQPDANNLWSPRYARTQMRPFPNALPERKTTSWRKRNAPFFIQFPSRAETMLFGDTMNGRYFPDTYTSTKNDNEVFSYQNNVHPLSRQQPHTLYKHAFDSDEKTCGIVLHRSTDSELLVHSIKGKLRAYIWKPEGMNVLFPDSDKTIQICAKSVADVMSIAMPYRTVLLVEGDSLLAPKNHIVGLEDIDDIPHTSASFNHRI